MESKDITSTITTLPSVRTLLEENDIRILPQHRLKVPQTNLIPAICFYNGTFVPIHAGHINVLRETKQYIDNLGTHELLGAYISPSHSGRSVKKLHPEEIIGAGHRLAMINLAIENLDWVMVDLFEMFQPCNTSLTVTMNGFISRVRSQLPNGSQIDVFWLKGEDALFYTKPSDHLLSLGFHTVYILNRGSDESVIEKNNEINTVQDYHEKQWQNVRATSSFPERFHRIHAAHINLSSTRIRNCARKPLVTWEELHSCVQIDSITTYILQHHLWSTSTNALHTAIPVFSDFPREISDLTAELLSSMLSTNLSSSVKVTSFMYEQIGEGKGWNGRLYRLHHIQYSIPTKDDLPESMILKLSTGLWMQRVASIEPEFYSTLGIRISNIKIPKCYFTARHPQSVNESLLLLEDLSLNYESLGDRHSIDDSRVFLLIASIASLHAEFFKHPLLKQETFSWLPSFNSSIEHYQTAYAYKMADKQFTDWLESNLSLKACAYAKALLGHLPHLFQTLTDKQYTLSHGDFWINNIFIQRGQSYRLILFDWQTCCRANGLIDVVFFIRLLGSVRARSIESQVLQYYHQTLVKYGVSKYDLSTIREDYYSLALPFMYIVHSSWKVIRDQHYSEIVMILEDIVTYSKKTEQLTCDCELYV